MKKLFGPISFLIAVFFAGPSWSLEYYDDHDNGIVIARSGTSYEAPGTEWTKGAIDFRQFASMPGCYVLFSEFAPPAIEGWVSKLLVREALTVFVNSGSTVDNIRMEDMRSVLLGEITNSNKLGGGNHPISIHVMGGGWDIIPAKYSTTGRKQRFKSSRVYVQKWNLALKKIGVEKPNIFEKIINFHSSYEALRDAVASTPGALGFGLRGVNPHGLKMISVDGHFPNLGGYDSTYPLLFDVYMTSRESLIGVSAKKKAIEFLNYRLGFDKELLSTSF